MNSLPQKVDFQEEIFSLFPLPLYTGTRRYYREDLEEIGIGHVLDSLEEYTSETVLFHAKTLASIKPELAFHFLMNFRRLTALVGMDQLKRWVSVVLDIYDSQGLKPSREFVLQGDEHPDFMRFWGKGVSFQEVYGVLLNLVNALGGEEINLEGKNSHYTDILTIYLPQRIDLFPDKRSNFLLFKSMVTHKFAQITLGTYRLNAERLSDLFENLEERFGTVIESTSLSKLSRFFEFFPDSNLARDIFNLSETIRIESWISINLPGLYRDLTGLKKQLGLKRDTSTTNSPKTDLMEMMIYWWLTGKRHEMKNPFHNDIGEQALRLLKGHITSAESVEDVAEITAEIYALMEALLGPYDPVKPVSYMGELRPEEAERGRRRKRESTRLKFRQELSRLVSDLPECKEVHIEASDEEHKSSRPGAPQRQEAPKHLVIDGNPVPLPEALQKTVYEIYEDLGAIPSSYLAVTDDMSGHHFKSLCQMPEGTGYVLAEHGEGIHIFDEWDYRRQGYRKRWALLRESDAPAGGLEFALQTLDRYGGMIQRIKRQFERIRMDQTLLRRQKEGDGIDLDAAVEAFSDRLAGLNPSEKVFVQLRRDKRDIATAFLIDLSGSTSGWINEMERAALLILCEAMQVLRDRFSVYGFSGRTRKRCEVFRIKGFDEPYGDAVKRRIANLRALEYTRLGPPIRHLTTLLSDVEARTRLLITLSDGKPDDYDGYRGDYGIEDTRQALLEAKLRGIHPFCITIDKAEHSYLAHMYGAVNYVFIDNLSKLPIKIPEIYRKLTT